MSQTAESRSVLRKKLGGGVSPSPIADVVRLSDTYARLLEDRLRVITGRRPDVQVEKVGVERGLTALTDGDEAAVYAVAAVGIKLGGVARISLTFAFRLIEIMTGFSSGPGTPDQGDSSPEAEPDTPTLTPICRALMETPSRAIFEAFIDATGAVAPPDIQAAFAAPHLMSDAGDTDDETATADGLGISLLIGLGGGHDEHRLNVFLPLSTIDALDGDLAAPSAREPSTPSLWAGAMKTAARTAPLRMVSVLHQKSIAIGDVEAMSVGSVIPLPPGHKMEISLRIDAPDGVTKAATIGGGVLGALDGQRAVRLTGPPDPQFLNHLSILDTTEPNHQGNGRHHSDTQD